MFERKKYADLIAHIPKKEYTILIGARQTGKSTILKQLAKTLDEQGESIILLNLERKNILLDLNNSPENIFKYIPLSMGKRVIALIDEIQYLEDPTHFLKLLYDEYNERLKIVATGSNAFYIDAQFKDSLAGRKKIFELQTLDFEEFLLFKNQQSLLAALQNIRKNQISKFSEEPLLWAALEEYMTYGGYPSVVLQETNTDKIEMLYEIRDSFVKRDILEAGITDEIKFYKLFMLLASQSGNLLNINELANTIRLPQPLTEEYLYVLQKCFHIGLVRPYFKNLRKELVKMPKIYFNDLGLRNALLNYFLPLEQRADKGATLENYVYHRLTELYTHNQIKFWRTTDGNEVDFIIEENAMSGFSIEVKFNENEAKMSKYNKFIETYPELPLSFKSWKTMSLLF
jgi:predicted AAA+ superfamily ATPase